MFTVIATSLIIGVTIGAATMSWLERTSERDTPAAAQPAPRHAAGEFRLAPASTRRSLSSLPPRDLGLYDLPPRRRAGHPSLLRASLTEATTWLAIDRAVRAQEHRDFEQYLAAMVQRWDARTRQRWA